MDVDFLSTAHTKHFPDREMIDDVHGLAEDENCDFSRNYTVGTVDNMPRYMFFPNERKVARV